MLQRVRSNFVNAWQFLQNCGIMETRCLFGGREQYNFSIDPMNITPILHEVNRLRRRENKANALKFFGVVFLTLLLGAAIAVFADPESSVIAIPFLV